MKTYQDQQDSLVTERNPLPFEVTEANACNINPTACEGGLNPQYDAHQRRYEKTDTGTAASYRTAVRAIANRIADKHTRQSKMRVEHLRAEFVTECESAIGEFIGTRVARFPRLASDLLARFAIGDLPSATVRGMHRKCRKACDARSARMAGKSQLVEPSFFNLFACADDTDTASTELTVAWVNARIDYLLGQVKERGAVSGNAQRAANAHAKLLEQARTYFLASIEGNAVKLPSAGIVPVSVSVGFNHVQTFHGKKLVASEGYVVSETLAARKTRGETVSRSDAGDGQLSSGALYKRVLRMASFVGASDIQNALARGMKTHG